MKRIVLLRHGESTWNKDNRFTGWTDVDLTEKGIADANQAGILLKEKGFHFDKAYTSFLKRAVKTLNCVLDKMDQDWIPVEKSWRLNEKHYGALQGLNKSETASKYGEEQVLIWRRSFNVAPNALPEDDPRNPKTDTRYKEVPDKDLPRTESLKETVERILPYWKCIIFHGIFEKISFSEIAHTLATGLNGAFDTLASFTATFDWDEMVDNITGGIVTFMQEFDWKENGQKLENFINHLLTSLIDIAEGVDWEAFGHNVGVFLSEIDWGKHLAQLLTVIGDVLGGIWEGLGTTSAGTFVQAMAVFAIGDKLMPLVDTITKFFTGDTVFGNLSKAVQGMLSPAITEAVSTTIPALGTSLGSLVATGGGIALAVGGAVLLTKKLAGLFETMQGGNGMTTQYGGYLHDYATQLTNVANLTNEQSEALWQLIEKDEELGKNS